MSTAITGRTPQRVRHPLRFRPVQVLHVKHLTPRMCRVTFGGDALEGFASAAADDHVKLFFPAAGQDRPALPAVDAEGRPAWPDGTRPVSRDYTPRRFDPARRELEIEFVVHGDGPASTWAERAAPGQWLGIGGPRGSLLVPDDHAAYLLLGDETALPAIARRLEEAPAGARVTALIEVADRREERHLPTSANATVRWLHRDGAAPGTTALLDEALRALPPPHPDTHAWLAGEIETARRLRRHLVEVSGLPRAQVHAAGYWRIGQADAHARLDD